VEEVKKRKDWIRSVNEGIRQDKESGGREKPG
jgi:hypothetical protein